MMSEKSRNNTSVNNQHYEKVYRSDRWARRFITAGGYGIIASIAAIMLFLLYQSLPLGTDASLDELLHFDAGHSGDQILLSGIDPYMEVFYELDTHGRIRFFSVSDQSVLLEDSLPLTGAETVLTAAKGNLVSEVFTVGTDSGRIITAEIKMKPRYTEMGREIVPSLSIEEEWQAPTLSDSIPNHVEQIAFAQNEDDYRFWAWTDHVGRLQVRIYDADEESEYEQVLAPDLDESKIVSISVSQNGENLVIGTTGGDLHWWDLSDYETAELKDSWNHGGSAISNIKHMLGDQALIVGTAAGQVEVWFPTRTPANNFRYRRAHTFEMHPASIQHIFASARNRNFLTIDAKGNARLHYSTTGITEIKFKPGDYPIHAGALAPKANGILLLNSQRQFTLFNLDNPHPETTLSTLFSRIWYEGYPQAEFVWQSTGGSDEFEPKLSLVPVIFGTLKGTLYAMLFSIPLAILAAIYVSQFSPKWMARSIKPTVEIMAALPSVVIGLLAGLYFSPYFEEHLMTVFLSTILLPVAFLAGMLIWRSIPEERRMLLQPGWELLLVLPILLVSVVVAVMLAQQVENWLFDGNFQQWLFTTTGITYETRNSLVVGFALGFAVIPIIFTVSEDALSNVPESLSSASLALGASKWQTVRRVVLPAASAGIFAAIMLGLGRAVGETMIVLMATGNTPILDLNPFNGFRAMSACIAVEIPEAPVGGTLYRVLFLTAFLLFMFTFVLNTISSMIGEKLRKKYARF